LIWLSFALSAGLSFGLGLSTGLSLALSYGLMYGLASVLVSRLLNRLQEGVYPTERVRWTWRNLRMRLFAFTHIRLALMLTGCIIVFAGGTLVLSVGLSVGLRMGWNSGLRVGLTSGLNAGLGAGLSEGLSLGLLYWLLLGLYQSIAQERIEDQDRRVPNQGIRQSLRNSMLLAFTGGLMIGGIGIVTFGLSNWLSIGWNAALISTLANLLSQSWSLFVAGSILIWVSTGGLMAWRHYLIRLLLRRTQTFPWNMSRFLDDATARILLRRLGGGYQFTHRLLLEALADTTERHTEQTVVSAIRYSVL
jgi:hypothetical protein